MKRTIMRAAFITIFCATFLSLVPANAAAPCSLSLAAGSWAFTDSGTVIGIGPRIAVGTFTLDSAGNVLKGVATASFNGLIENETFSGTYTVDADCNGTISVNVAESDGDQLLVTVNIAFDNNMKHMRGIFTSIEAGGTSIPSVISLDANKQ